MNGTPFKLATFAATGGGHFPALVLGEDVIAIPAAYRAYRDSPRRSAGALGECDSVFGLLQDWDANFAVLQAMVAFIESEGVASERFRGATARLDDLRALAPVLRPGKILNAAQNFQEHVDEMIRAGMSPQGRTFTGEKSTSHPYLFLKAGTCLCGATDDIAIPHGMSKIDWEAELCFAIGRGGKRIRADRAIDHIAGFLTGNDVSCRDLQVRPDRPGLRSDWYGGKCHDNFAPMGPFLVPRAFVPDHMTLAIRLTVNGEVRQNGNTSQFIYTPEEQIEFSTGILRIEPGDLFFGGTCGGVGQGMGKFLKVGDMMETEIEGLGRMRNRFIAEPVES